MISALELLSGLKTDVRMLSRALTYVENDLPEGRELLKRLPLSDTVTIIGITGPPGAGKSTLINAIVTKLSEKGSRTAILAVDPTSPFSFGSLLGDRVRMNHQFTNSKVFIRSLATRGSLGGLSAKTIEMTDVLKAAGFDHILVETVGVGQSEVEIAELADITMLVLVPGYGDEIQDMKSGIMEIADIFIINKSDRPGAGTCANTIKKLLHQKGLDLPVIKTSSESGEGIDELVACIISSGKGMNNRKAAFLAERAYKLIESRRMRDITRDRLKKMLEEQISSPDFNLYQFVEVFLSPDSKIQN